MDKPQQPELDRSGRGEVDPQGRRVNREAEKRERERDEKGAKVPPGNQPGKRLERDQDKPPPLH